MRNAEPFNRREFLRRAVLVGGGGALAASVPAFSCQVEPVKTKVVVVTCSEVMKDEGSLNVGALRRMLERGISELAGKSDGEAAWRTFIRPTDQVAMVDAGTWLLNVPPLVVEVLKGIASASPASLTFAYCSLDERNSAFMEAVRGGLQRAALPREMMKGDIYTIPGQFEKHPFTTLVMTPTLKSHTIAGVSGVVKHYATMSKTHVSSYHANAMETAGSVIPAEFGHLRHLIIVDALRWGQTTQGPQFYQQSLILGTDPVATDVVALQLFLRNCKTHGDIPPDRHRILADTRYHAGISDLDRIAVTDVTV